MIDPYLYSLMHLTIQSKNLTYFKMTFCKYNNPITILIRQYYEPSDFFFDLFDLIPNCKPPTS